MGLLMNPRDGKAARKSRAVIAVSRSEKVPDLLQRAISMVRDSVTMASTP